jgi:VWFA-related protein
MKQDRPAALVMATLMFAGPGAAGQAPPRERERPVFSAESAAVLVDVVVRDKKGHLVRDLTASDFEVYEDGDKQVLQSFRVVESERPGDSTGATVAEAEPAPPGGPPPGADAIPPAPSEPEKPAAPAVVAFVFDRLTPTARALARTAALSYTERNHEDGDLVGVFTIDLALRNLVAFTTDLARVRAAIEAAAAQGNTQFASEREDARGREKRADQLAEQLGALGGSGIGGSSSSASAVAGVLAVAQASEQMQANITRAFDHMERDQQGFATTHGLMAIVNGLRAIPGRKTLVFFSEGIAIPSEVEGQFRATIAAANRANVSIYAVDAAGLRVESGLREAREEMVRNAQTRLRQEEAAGSGRPTREALNRGMERNEEALRLAPESGLGQISEETGGFLLQNTNDLRGGFKRIGEDMRFHYLLSYSPTNAAFDGTFRTIAVKLRRPNLHVQSRKGYLAVRPEYVLPVRGYEAPALAQLDRSPAPEAFPVGAGALSFPEATRPGLVPVLVSVPGGTMRWDNQASAGAHAEFSIVVRIKDEQGREADRLGQDYRLTAPADKVDAARRGEVLFYRETDLSPGRYTAEAVAYDALAGVASVRRTPFEVPKADRGRLRLSSLVMVGRVEKLSGAEEAQDSPLHFGEVMLYPSLGLPFRKSVAPAAGFFFSVYGQEAGTAAKALIEVRKGEKVVAQSSANLPAADATGRTQHAGALPLKGMAPGDYRLRVSVGEGASAVAREAAFTVVD